MKEQCLKVINILCSKKRIINFFSYIVLFVALILSCFFETATWAVFSLSIVIACFNGYQKNLELIIFLNCFSVVLTNGIVSELYLLITYIVTAIMGVRYIFQLIKKTKKINFKLLIPILILIIYFALPPHKVTIVNLVRYVINYALIYIVFENRESLNFKNLVIMLCMGLILSSFVALLRPISDRLQGLINVIWPTATCKYPRFSGLYEHSNLYGVYVAIAFGGLFALKLKNKINLVVFYVFYTVLMIFSYITISRGLVVALAIGIIIFSIFDIIKRKKKALLFNLSLYIIIGIIAACFLFETKIYLVRFNLMSEQTIANVQVDPSYFDKIEKPSFDINDYKENNSLDKILAGEIFYDPGRIGLYKLYLTDFSSSIKTILFGRGISAPRVGQMSAHNMVIQMLWQNGIVGLILHIIVFAMFFVNKKSLKRLKSSKYWLELFSLFVFLIPFAVSAMFESIQVITDLIVFILALLLLHDIDKQFDDDQEELRFLAEKQEGDTQGSEKIDDSKLISVIVPVYKVEEYLPRCVESLINQTYKNLEIILIDDGSPDNCGKICDEYAKKDKRIKVIHKENGGVSSARNLGIDKARGEFITFVDSDDYLEMNMYEKMMCKQVKDNSDLVFCRYKEVYTNHKIYVKEQSLENFCETKDLSVLLNHSTRVENTGKMYNTYDYVMCSIWRILFRADLLKKYRFNTNIKIMEDTVLLTELVMKEDCKISYVDEYLYSYIIRGNSALHQKNNYIIKNNKVLMNEFERILTGTSYSHYIEALKFYCYSECAIQKYVQGAEIDLNEVKEWNNKENYKALLNANVNDRAKVKFFVIRHNLNPALKFLYFLHRNLK